MFIHSPPNKAVRQKWSHVPNSEFCLAEVTIQEAAPWCSFVVRNQTLFVVALAMAFPMSVTGTELSYLLQVDARQPERGTCSLCLPAE